MQDAPFGYEVDWMYRRNHAERTCEASVTPSAGIPADTAEAPVEIPETPSMEPSQSTERHHLTLSTIIAVVPAFDILHVTFP